jgi:hypothetical protein
MSLIEVSFMEGLVLTYFSKDFLLRMPLRLLLVERRDILAMLVQLSFRGLIMELL